VSAPNAPNGAGEAGARGLVGRPATELAEMVREGGATAREVVTAHLDHLAAVDDRLGAFVVVRREAALAEAAVLDERDDRDQLPLAGVPVAVKDNLDVAGVPTRHGSRATSAEPAAQDAEVVARLREAGAIVVGKTRCPELVIWGTTDDHEAITVSPWDTSRTAGGSSGGSGAAVGAGVVPIAVASDGMGSIRIPAAACGCVGIKPGEGILPEVYYGEAHWFGLGHIGPIATTIADLRLGLDVMAGTDRFRRSRGEGTVDRSRFDVAVSWAAPAGEPVARPWQEAAVEAGRVLRHLGHVVEHADPPYSPRATAWTVTRYLQGPLQDVEGLGLEVDRLQPRTLGHLRAGELIEKVLPVDPEQAETWKDRVRPFFEQYDVLVTPVFAGTQPKAVAWRERSWIANFAVNARTYPFTRPWNFADLPAASVPIGEHEGRPLAVQVVAGRGREDVVLAVAEELERSVGWERHAPGWGVTARR
jgi:amidase